MVWHEVVTDYFDNTNEMPVAITYCPISGSLAAYNLHATKRKLSLGVSGELLNNNSLLMIIIPAAFGPSLQAKPLMAPLKAAFYPACL
jgi:Protein of unknown function (DUF3179).